MITIIEKNQPPTYLRMKDIHDGCPFCLVTEFNKTLFIKIDGKSYVRFMSDGKPVLMHYNQETDDTPIIKVKATIEWSRV